MSEFTFTSGVLHFMIWSVAKRVQSAHTRHIKNIKKTFYHVKLVVNAGYLDIYNELYLQAQGVVILSSAIAAAITSLKLKKK
jgi:hypothetical protein